MRPELSIFFQDLSDIRSNQNSELLKLITKKFDEIMKFSESQTNQFNQVQNSFSLKFIFQVLFIKFFIF